MSETALNIEVSLIKYEDKSILEKLLQLYRYDSSEYDDHVLNKHGLYPYKYLDHQWTDDYRRSYLIKVNGEIAGFVLLMLEVPPPYTKLSDVAAHSISDFFVMRKFRGRGVGLRTAAYIFQQHRGTWEVAQTATNHPAQRVWERTIAKVNDCELIKKESLKGSKWNGPVMVFKVH